MSAPLSRNLLFLFPFCAALLAGCQSPPAIKPIGYSGTTEGGVMTARPLTDAEMAKAMKSAQRASDMAPAIVAANTFGGLDPTGMTQMAVTAETTRRMQDFQQYIPGMMAANVQRLEAYCKTNPRFDACIEFRKTKAEMKARCQRMPDGSVPQP
ncbi:hypothetical protein [Rhizobium laguerreae]|uniref:hypothetical protein n=1 Tax=Rhizobium laguerreae TaxID=1076926 RepID=UPI00103E6929|nr:hypothetical protein [Rhizobium laguerreae]MBY3314421.1 hypothetical protein [Rhizobium laguerreae]TBY08128.1 hypothetical protein E0J21_14085 [Rhizobium laguerreae]